jgi:hypothetical protein
MHVDIIVLISNFLYVSEVACRVKNANDVAYSTL